MKIVFYILYKIKKAIDLKFNFIINSKILISYI